MDYNDKLAIMAAIVLSARMARGNTVNSKEIVEAVRVARKLCNEVETASPES